MRVFSGPAVLGECSITSTNTPALFALAGLLALSIKGKVLSSGAPIGPGEQDPAGSLSSRPDWLEKASVKGEGARGIKRNIKKPCSPPEKEKPAGSFLKPWAPPEQESCDWPVRPEG